MLKNSYHRLFLIKRGRGSADCYLGLPPNSKEKIFRRKIGNFVVKVFFLLECSETYKKNSSISELTFFFRVFFFCVTESIWKGGNCHPPKENLKWRAWREYYFVRYILIHDLWGKLCTNIYVLCGCIYVKIWIQYLRYYRSQMNIHTQTKQQIINFFSHKYIFFNNMGIILETLIQDTYM